MVQPYGVAVDSYGNVYISDHQCHVVMKWIPNVTTGILVAGQLNTGSSTGQLLYRPKCIFLDEVQLTLYVVDFGNDRVQKFFLGTNKTGITVAGGNGVGSGLNQLNGPTGVWISSKDRSIYVNDTYNYRVMKWSVNATQGIIVAGVTGETGSTPLPLDTPGDVALDPTETFIYVADYDNSRVQRFLL
jgi:DNA-binding beta-propeller fold protein YncE